MTTEQICPLRCAAIFWGQHVRMRGGHNEVTFVRVPNR